MPIRLRLALWCGAILAVGLLGFSALIYLLVGHTLRADGDEVIAGRAHRVDTLLATATRATAGAGLQAELARAVRIFSSPGVWILLADEEGGVLARTQGSTIPGSPCRAGCRPGGGSTGATFRALLAARDPIYYDQRVSGEPFRMFAVRRSGAGPVRYILAGHSIQYIADTLHTLLILLLAGSALCLAVVAAAAWLLARRALAPIAALTHTAARIAESGDFVARVQAPARRDEVGQLAATFNAMLDRLAESHVAQRRFVSDASHELRAPLTTIRGNAELLLLDPGAPAAEREDALRDIAAEGARLTRLVDGLLALARGDAGQRARPQPVRLHEVVTAACQSLAERRGIPRLILARSAPVLVHADPDRLEQLLIILLDNAVKYTPAGGTVTVSLRAEDGWAVLQVRDTGIGIHPDDLPHIFERFYRADTARSRDAGAGQAATAPGAVPGTGLGLAIARQIVDEAEGTIAAERAPGQGALFTVRLPAATRALPTS